MCELGTTGIAGVVADDAVQYRGLVGRLIQQVEAAHLQCKDKSPVPGTLYIQ